MAYKQGYDLIYTLDDDTIPMHKDFFLEHEEALGRDFGQVHKGMCINPLDSEYFSRGFPYHYRTNYEDESEWKENNVKVVFNMGLWHGVPDVNTNDYEKPWGAYMVADGITQRYLPLCSMNICFRSELVPVYGLQLPLDRYDDIISGYILERILQGTNKYIGFGNPAVMHLRYPRDRNRDIYLQTMSLPIIEMLPDVLDTMKVPDGSLSEKYEWIARHLYDKWSYIGKSEIKRLCKLMLHWTAIVQKL
jgi:hypothetical protein